MSVYIRQIYADIFSCVWYAAEVFWSATQLVSQRVPKSQPSPFICNLSIHTCQTYPYIYIWVSISDKYSYLLCMLMRFCNAPHFWNSFCNVFQNPNPVLGRVSNLVLGIFPWNLNCHGAVSYIIYTRIFSYLMSSSSTRRDVYVFIHIYVQSQGRVSWVYMLQGICRTRYFPKSLTHLENPGYP